MYNFYVKNHKHKGVDSKFFHCYNKIAKVVLFMKKLTRIFCLFLVIPLLLCACEKKKPVEAPTEPPKSAQDYINSGEYEKAYDLLILQEDPTEEEQALLDRFRFLKLETVGEDGYKLICTYDEKGQLLTRDETTAKGTWNKLAYTYDEKGQVLTETTTSFSGTTDTSREQTYTYTYDETGNILTKD